MGEEPTAMINASGCSLSRISGVRAVFRRMATCSRSSILAMERLS